MSSSRKKRSRNSSSHSKTKNDEESDSKKFKTENLEVEKIKHFDSFYKEAPPGLVQEEEEKPEECIPDEPENQEARHFLANAPKKGLWMPLGKEVKVMKCWRCKRYGHRTGDRECPMFVSGNTSSEKFRYAHEDPMHDLVNQNKNAEKLEKVKMLQALLDDDTSSSSDSSSSEDSHNKSHKSHHKQKRKHKHKSKSKKKNKKKKSKK